MTNVTSVKPAVKLSAYIKIARFDHWVKNVFMLPGAAFAYAMSASFSYSSLVRLAIGILATGLIASANYSINEYLDAEFDRIHPLKRDRPAAEGRIVGGLVVVQYLVLAVLGLGLALTINTYFFLTGLFLLVMGILYNVKPFRTKDRMLLDVISESVNNPLRFLLGWFCITSVALPPSSVLLSYWAGGAFLMAMKRYAEYRQIGNPQVAGDYRRSFKFYTERRLLVSAFFYALNSAFFLGVFLIKYRIEYILLFPFLSLLFVEYLLMSMKEGSSAYAPEKLYKERRLMLIVGTILVLTLILSVVRLPELNFLLQKVTIGSN